MAGVCIFGQFFMELINIGPAYIRGWEGGVWGDVGGGKSLNKEERRYKYYILE